jgi:hypothetical protein
MTIITYEGRMGSRMSAPSLLMWSEFSKRNKERIYTRYINPRSSLRAVESLEWINFKTTWGIMDPNLEYLLPYRRNGSYSKMGRLFILLLEQSRQKLPKKTLECDIYLNGRKLEPFEEQR